MGDERKKPAPVAPSEELLRAFKILLPEEGEGVTTRANAVATASVDPPHGSCTPILSDLAAWERELNLGRADMDAASLRWAERCVWLVRCYRVEHGALISADDHLFRKRRAADRSTQDVQTLLDRVADFLDLYIHAADGKHATAQTLLSDVETHRKRAHP